MPPKKPETSLPSLQPHQPVTGRDMTKSSHSLAIALVVSAILLLAALGIALWLLFFKGSGGLVSGSIPQPESNDTKDIKNVSFVVPAMPAQYAKNDQSAEGTTNVFYYDDATNCGITLSVVPVNNGQNAKDAVVAAVTVADAQGVTTAASKAGDKLELKDTAKTDKTYTFDTVALDQNVNVPSVAFTKQHNVIAYKQFGLQVASVAYACKEETWAEKNPELLALVKTLTVKAEK